MTDAEVGLLGEAGVSHMGFGTESASPEVLALMNKKHQRIDEMYETARKSEQAGIRVTFNLILGYPGETEADRLETFRIMSDIACQALQRQFFSQHFHPVPGDSHLARVAKNGRARAAIPGRVGQRRSGEQPLALAARQGTRPSEADARVFPAPQSDPESRRRGSLDSPRCAPGSGRAFAMAIAEERVCDSVGTMVGARHGAPGHAAFPADGANVASWHAGSLLKSGHLDRRGAVTQRNPSC